jgi:hypothetical protein
MRKEKSEWVKRCEWYPSIWPLYPANEEDIKIAKADRDYSYLLRINPKTNIFTVDYYDNWWKQEMKSIKIDREKLNKKLNEMYHKGCALWWVR